MREEHINFLMKDVALFLVVSQSAFVYKRGRGGRQSLLHICAHLFAYFVEWFGFLRSLIFS